MKVGQPHRDSATKLREAADFETPRSAVPHVTLGQPDSAPNRPSTH